MGSLRIVLTGAALLAVLVLAGGAGAQSPTLFGVVGPGASIRLSDAAGNPVKHLDPGTYVIEVKDLAAEHNFHLGGPGSDHATDVEGMGMVIWTITLSDGIYRYQCDAHPTTMFGLFAVGTATLPTPKPPPPPKPSASKPVQLMGSVGPGKRIGLTRAGASSRVASVKAGAAVLRVSDRTATDNFHLTGPGVNRATAKAGRATVTWKLALKRGVYAYRSDATSSLKGSFRVT